MIIGITGPAGAGKSLAAHFLRSRGFTVINADRVGHSVLKRPEIKRMLRKRFGDRIFQGRKISRKKLGNLVFGNPRELKRLNAVVHPAIRRKIRSDAGSHQKRKTVIDAALLFSLDLANLCDMTICVTAPPKTLLRRLLRRDKQTDRRRALGILNAQSGHEKYCKKCDHVIVNDGSVGKLEKNLIKICDLA